MFKPVDRIMKNNAKLRRASNQNKCKLFSIPLYRVIENVNSINEPLARASIQFRLYWMSAAVSKKQKIKQKSNLNAGR